VTTLARLQDQRDALDALITAWRHALAVGAVSDDAPAPPAPAAAGPVTQPTVPAPAKPRKARPLRVTPAAPTDPEPAPAAASEPLLLGSYDQRILACLKLAPPLGMTAKEVVKGVAGKKADDQAVYQVVWSALQSLSRRDLIRKDGRYYLPAEEVA
jgi:hypothetical protein